MKLNLAEQKVMDRLVQAWNAFHKLDSQHPMEKEEFCSGIHRCQDLLAVRVARRVDPSNFKTF